MLPQAHAGLPDGEALRLGGKQQPARGGGGEEGKAVWAEACVAKAGDCEGTQSPETEEASAVAAQAQLR